MYNSVISNSNPIFNKKTNSQNKFINNKSVKQIHKSKLVCLIYKSVKQIHKNKSGKQIRKNKFAINKSVKQIHKKQISVFK